MINFSDHLSDRRKSIIFFTISGTRGKSIIFFRPFLRKDSDSLSINGKSRFCSNKYDYTDQYSLISSTSNRLLISGEITL